MVPGNDHISAITDLEEQLKRFIDTQNQQYYDDTDEALLESARNGTLDIEAVIRNFEKLNKDEIADPSDIVGPNDDEIFAQSFHTLVHSSSLPAILIQEQTYAKVVASLSRGMNEAMSMLNSQQQQEMEANIELLDKSTTTDDINRLLGQHHSYRDMVQSQWQTELDGVRCSQKEKYRRWITDQVSENFINNESTHTAMGSRSSIFSVQNSSMEESFTIHLGSQLKHMHNIRILSADVADLCSPLHQTEK